MEEFFFVWWVSKEGLDKKAFWDYSEAIDFKENLITPDCFITDQDDNII